MKRKKDTLKQILGLDGSIVETETILCNCPCHLGLSANHIQPCCEQAGQLRRGRNTQRRTSKLPWDFPLS